MASPRRFGRNHNPTLRVKQRTCHFDRAIGRGQRRCAKTAAKGIAAAPRDLRQCGAQSPARHVHQLGERLGGRGLFDGALRLGLFEILELARNRCNSCVKHSPSHAFWLGQDCARGLRIALRFVPKPPPRPIDLNATLHNHGPSDQYAMRMSDIAMPLIGPKMRGLQPQLRRPSGTQRCRSRC